MQIGKKAIGMRTAAAEELVRFAKYQKWTDKQKRVTQTDQVPVEDLNTMEERLSPMLEPWVQAAIDNHVNHPETHDAARYTYEDYWEDHKKMIEPCFNQTLEQ